MKKLEREHTKARKRADQLQKEKDQSRAEMTKAVQLKGKLETLCRELQKENKRIKVDTHTSRLLPSLVVKFAHRLIYRMFRMRANY